MDDQAIASAHLVDQRVRAVGAVRMNITRLPEIIVHAVATVDCHPDHMPDQQAAVKVRSQTFVA